MVLIGGRYIMSLNFYLFFNGNCREAVSLYADVFNAGEPEIMTYGQSPSDGGHPLPSESRDLVMHAHLTISGSSIMFSDVVPGKPYTQGNNFSITVVTKDVDEINHAFAELSKGGKVTMELQETFWSPCYGMLTDKFGIDWQFSLQA